MKAICIPAVCILTAAGCTSSTNGNNEAATPPNEPSASRPLAGDAKSWPTQITNQFGMTFSLVTIDTSRADHRDSFPAKSYYLQQTELTGQQNEAFQKAADSGGIFQSGPRRSLPTRLVQPYVPVPRGSSPSEWREAFWYARALSTLDSDFDYRLPSRAEWTFACMSGYEQRCDLDKPNAYGCTGMLGSSLGDAEAIDEYWGEGRQSAVLMGYWKNNWHEHDGETKPDCPCEYWTVCNADGDDSLNELITARFVLMPKHIAEGPKP